MASGNVQSSLYTSKFSHTHSSFVLCTTHYAFLSSFHSSFSLILPSSWHFCPMPLDFVKLNFLEPGLGLSPLKTFTLLFTLSLFNFYFSECERGKTCKKHTLSLSQNSNETYKLTFLVQSSNLHHRFVCFGLFCPAHFTSNDSEMYFWLKPFFHPVGSFSSFLDFWSLDPRPSQIRHRTLLLLFFHCNISGHVGWW